MKNAYVICLLTLIVVIGCNLDSKSNEISESEKAEIEKFIQLEIDQGVEATRTKNIDLYMSQMSDDLVIFGESGEIISKQKQREYALRDWAIIDTTLRISMKIDSIQFLRRDSVLVFTYQKWERMMFQRDGITMDTVLTTQKHKETWKKRGKEWFGYEVKELGGEIFINGQAFNPE